MVTDSTGPLEGAEAMYNGGGLAARRKRSIKQPVDYQQKG
jgi:hypothetical protein